jgi:hypothetical protein
VDSGLGSSEDSLWQQSSSTHHWLCYLELCTASRDGYLQSIVRRQSDHHNYQSLRGTLWAGSRKIHSALACSVDFSCSGDRKQECLLTRVIMAKHKKAQYMQFADGGKHPEALNQRCQRLIGPTNSHPHYNLWIPQTGDHRSPQTSTQRPTHPPT